MDTEQKLGEFFARRQVQVLNEFEEQRADAVRRGLESPELAALMVEKFGEGIWRVLDDGNVIKLADDLCAQIDPDYQANRALRYDRYAGLDLSKKRQA